MPYLPYIKLGCAALLPVLATVILYFLDKNTVFGKININVKQIIFGIVFGCLAVIGTEWGIRINGAMMNCRDAAVITAGLMFGAPAGIIAGIIGGVERWIAVAWGVGSFTRVACSVSTVIAGFYAALLRKYMFEDKKPGSFISLAIGVVMEVFHLTMVFITNMATPNEAMAVVKACTFPMIISNGLSVMLSAVVLTIMTKEKFGSLLRGGARISQTIQRWLLLTVLLAFTATSYFVFKLQDTIALKQTDDLLNLAIDEVAADIEDTADQNLLKIAHQVVGELNGDNNLKIIAKKHNIAEISIIYKNGIIVASSEDKYVGFNMASGEQSSEFLCLLSDKEEYVQKYGPISSDSSILRKYAGVKTDTGFVQIGYDAEEFQKDIDTLIVGITKNRHVGNTGFIIILDSRFNVVSAPDSITQISFAPPSGDTIFPEQDQTFTMNISGVKNYCRYSLSEGYYIVSLLPYSEALQMRNIALYVNSFMEILVFAVLFGLIYLLIKRVVVNQIKKINNSLAKITSGDLGVVVDVRTNEEFASLSDDINSTVDTLKHYINEASARIDKELEFAKNIQASALPSVFPAFPKRKDFDIFASMNPAKEVGGDFYDFYMTNGDKLHFLIADVSGKGIPAAMFMMRAKTELKTLTESDIPLSEVFTHGNAALCEGNDAGMFVTAWQGGIDLDTGIVTYANAGHNPPLIKHNEGKFEYLKARPGFVLAGVDGVKYKTSEIQLTPGDVIYLYTDGVTEATNANTELYGEDRLLAAINSKDFANVREMCEYIKSDVDAFVGEAPQFDDITMVAFKYVGKPPVPSISFENATLDDITVVTAFIESELEKIDCPMKTVVQINVAIDEIFSNIVRYGYKDKSGPVTVELKLDDDLSTAYIKFIDEGIPYNPLKKEDPDVTLSAEERGIGGLGIFMVKKTMDDMKYEYENDKNILTLVKKINR